jgi:undecaprenyl-diphosphatase
METLLSFDYWLFERINQDGANSYFDSLFPVLSELHRVPVVAFVLIPSLLLFFLIKLRLRFIPMILALGLSIAIADMTTHHLIKKTVARPRPSQTDGLAVTVRTFNHAGYSFPSNHAANNFAAAMILSSFLYSWRRFFYLFAFLVAYSRIYVGVHFPLDVAAGAIWGCAIAMLILKTIRPFDLWLRTKFPSKNYLPEL